MPESPTAQSSGGDPFERYPDAVREAWRLSQYADVCRESTCALLDSAIELVIGPGEEIPFPFAESERMSGVGRPGLVIDGLVRIYVASSSRQVTVQYAGAADAFAVPALAPVSGASQLVAGGQAIVSTQMLLLSPATFGSLLRSDLTLAPAVIRGLREALYASVALMAENVLWPLRQRVARHLLDMAVREEGRVTVPATVQEIADATGTVREVVTRLLKEMRAKGLIAREDGRLVLCDMRALHLAARGELPTEDL